VATQAPVVESNTLASCSAYDEIDTFRGASAEMADGSVRFELVASGVKREFTLSWEMLTAAQLATVRAAWAALATSYNSNNFTSVLGVTFTVTRHPDQKELKFTAVLAAGGLRYKTEMRLREV
jgi:hypothetical protein